MKPRHSSFRDILGFACSLPLVVLAAATAAGQPISSADYFTGIPHTLLTFETDGSGNAVTVPEGGVSLLSATEYVTQGIVFDRDIWWGNEASSDADAALALGGSLQLSLQAPLPEDYTISFTGPVRAFGFWMIHHTGVTLHPTMTILDDQLEQIETLSFTPDRYAGVVGEVAYGFVGFVSDRNIASVRIERNASNIDNLHLSPIPEPGTWSLLGLAAISLAGYAWLRSSRR